ncbi:MAG: hypothetical protein ACLGH4_01590 [Actinomycetes bacterium]
MNDRVPRNERDRVLVDVKAKPFGWPMASLDPRLRARSSSDERDAGLRDPTNSGLYGFRGLPVEYIGGGGGDGKAWLRGD